MALSLREAIERQERTAEIVGIPLARDKTAQGLSFLAEIAHLVENIEAKDAHITTLETQVWAWRSQAMNESKAREQDAANAYEREGELVRVIHHQMTELDRLRSKKTWWRR